MCRAQEGDVGRHRVDRGRHDRPLETQARGLVEAAIELRRLTKLAGQPDLAADDEIVGDRLIGHRRRNRHGHREVGTGLGDPDPADHRHIGLAAENPEVAPTFEHRQQERDPVGVDALGGAAGTRGARFDDQRLELHEQRPMPVEDGHDGRPGGALVAIGEEEPTRIGHGDEALRGHLDDAGFAGGAEAVLHGSQEPQALMPVALERDDGVDQVLERAGPGERALLGHVADEHGGDRRLLRHVEQRLGAFAHLRDRTRHRGHRRR